jgi:hypothetical protein
MGQFNGSKGSILPNFAAGLASLELGNNRTRDIIGLDIWHFLGARRLRGNEFYIGLYIIVPCCLKFELCSAQFFCCLFPLHMNESNSNAHKEEKKAT